MFSSIDLQQRSERFEHRRECNIHGTDGRSAPESRHAGPIERVTPLFRFEQPAHQFAEMPQIFFEVVYAGREDRCRQPRIRDDAGALPEALQHHAGPFEIADPVTVQIQDDLGALRQGPAGFGGRTALFGERRRWLAIDAPQAMPIGQRLQSDQRIVPPRRSRANKQQVNRPLIQPVLRQPVIGLPGKGITPRQRNAGYIETRLGVARAGQMARHEMHDIASRRGAGSSHSAD